MKSTAGIREVIAQLKSNRPGYVGFLLSMLQLLIHGSWIAYITWLSNTGIAKTLPPGAWQFWVITVAVLLGAALTMISLFLCLYGALHGRPKTLAIIGFGVSFFIGAFTTFGLALSYLSQQS